MNDAAESRVWTFKELLDEIEKLRQALSDVEWGVLYTDRQDVSHYYCPKCDAEQPDGHMDGCSVNLALRGATSR